MGSSLLALFVGLRRCQLGFWTILIAHIMFCLSLRGGHRQGPAGRPGPAARSRPRWTSTPTSGRPSGGSPCRWCCPASSAAALLSFSLSFDDFIITNFNSGSTVTFPMFVWGAAQRGIPPQINVDRHGRCSLVSIAARCVARRAERPTTRRRRASLTGASAGPSRRWRDAAARGRSGSTTRRARSRCRRSSGDASRRPGRRRRRLHRAVDGAAAPRSATPAATSCCSRPASCGWAARGRNGGFCARQPHPRLRQRARPLARRARRRWTGSGAENLDAHRADASAATASTATGSAPASSSVATAARTRLDELAAEADERPRPPGTTCELLDATRCAREVDSPTYLGGAAGDRDGTAMVDPARLAWGLRAACLDARGADPRGHPGARARPRHGARVGRAHRRTAGAAPAGRAGHQRLPAAAAAAAAVHRAGLRLRADDRAADGRAAGLDRLAEPAGRGRRGQPVPLLPAHPRRPDPVGRLRRGLPLRQPDRPRARAARRDLRAARRALLRRRSRSWRGCASPTAGAA